MISIIMQKPYTLKKNLKVFLLYLIKTLKQLGGFLLKVDIVQIGKGTPSQFHLR